MPHNGNSETDPFGDSSKMTETYSPTASLKKVAIAVLIGAGLIYTSSDTVGTVPTAYLTKGGKKPHETCPYDYKFHGITLLLQFSGKEGHESTYSCYEDTLKQWRSDKGLVQFGTHATLLYGINPSKVENVETFMTKIVPYFSNFDTPISLTTPTNVDEYNKYKSGNGWEFGDDTSMQMRFMELVLDKQTPSSQLQQLHSLVQKQFPSGGSSTPSGFVPHMSTVYANRGDPRCVTEHDIEDLPTVLKQAGCGLTALSEALQVTSIGLWDMDNKTSLEWVKIQEWSLPHTSK